MTDPSDLRAAWEAIKNDMSREAFVPWCEGMIAVLDSLQAQVDSLSKDLRHAVYIAEHLFAMVPRDVWRVQGAEWMGQYEGDYWAEQTQQQIADLRALVGNQRTED